MFSPVESRSTHQFTSIPVPARTGFAEEPSLSGRLITLAEEERKRLARELHDDIGQRISLLAVELDLLTVEQDCPNSVRDKLNQALGELKELASDVHNLSHRLHSSKLQHLGLPIALKEVCRHMATQHHIDIDLNADDASSALPEDVSLCFYRVAQEALNNAVKHSHSKRVEVRLENDESRVRLQVRDFGVGFDPSAQVQGLGLAAMQERLNLVGGTLAIRSLAGSGTELTAESGRQFRERVFPLVQNVFQKQSDAAELVADLVARMQQMNESRERLRQTVGKVKADLASRAEQRESGASDGHN